MVSSKGSQSKIHTRLFLLSASCNLNQAAPGPSTNPTKTRKTDPATRGQLAVSRPCCPRAQWGCSRTLARCRGASSARSAREPQVTQDPDVWLWHPQATMGRIIRLDNQKHARRLESGSKRRKESLEATVSWRRQKRMRIRRLLKSHLSTTNGSAGTAECR